MKRLARETEDIVDKFIDQQDRLVLFLKLVDPRFRDIVPELFGELIRKTVSLPSNAYGAISSKYDQKLRETIADMEAQLDMLKILLSHQRADLQEQRRAQSQKDKKSTRISYSNTNSVSHCTGNFKSLKIQNFKDQTEYDNPEKKKKRITNSVTNVKTFQMCNVYRRCHTSIYLLSKSSKFVQCISRGNSQKNTD